MDNIGSNMVDDCEKSNGLLLLVVVVVVVVVDGLLNDDSPARDSYSSSPPLDDCKLPLFPESMYIAFFDNYPKYLHNTKQEL